MPTKNLVKIILGGFILIPLLVSASGGGVVCPRFNPGRAPETLECLVPWIFYYILIVSGFLLVIVLIITGFKYLFATGNPSRIADAKDQLIKGFFGVVLVLASFMIVHILNPELVLRGIILPEIERKLIEPREVGVHFCYEITAEHFNRPDLKFRCETLSLYHEYRGGSTPPYIADRDKARYGVIQEYNVWACRPQIKHNGIWRDICYNLARPWLEMLPFDAYLYPDPLDKISDNGADSKPYIRKAKDATHNYHCKDLSEGRCLTLTAPENKCHIIEEIRIFTPKFQCYRFWTNSEIEQIASPPQEFTHYRKVVVEYPHPDRRVDYGVIFHEKTDFKGRCFFYQSDAGRRRGEVHPIGESFHPYDGADLLQIAKNFYSLSVIRIEPRQHKGKVTLFERYNFAGAYQAIYLQHGVNNTIEKRNLDVDLINNVRSLRIEKRIDRERVGDEPIVVILFSGRLYNYIYNRGFCEVFLLSDDNLEDNRIGAERIVDPIYPPTKRIRLPIRWPWLFYAPTAESIIIISGQQI